MAKEKFIPNGQKLILITCPHCGHRTRWGLGNVEILKKWMLGELPPCPKKGCGYQIKSHDMACPFTEKAPSVQHAKDELKKEGKEPLFGLIYA
jgi:hypothetical protein